MTENKRFYVAESNLIDGYCVFDKEKKYAFHPRPRKADCLNDAHTLNGLHEGYLNLKHKHSLLHDECIDLEVERNRLQNDVNSLEKENKELQERNNRQAKQLDNIYQLIEQKDYRALNDIMDDFKKAEEQLQSEWQTYGDD